MTQYKYLLATSIATAVLAASAMAPAAATDRQTGANASGRCQAALPAFETSIRKRPLALQNEGTANTFVTCSFVTDDSLFSTTDGFEIWARSTNGAAATLNCTAVVGYDTQSDAIYLAKSVVLPATNLQARLSFGGTTDYPNGIPVGLPISVSCAVPAGVALNDLYYYFQDGYADPVAPTATAG